MQFKTENETKDVTSGKLENTLAGGGKRRLSMSLLKIWYVIIIQL